MKNITQIDSMLFPGHGPRINPFIIEDHAVSSTVTYRSERYRIYINRDSVSKLSTGSLDSD